MKTSQELLTITEIIRETVECDKIYLFGSYAYGTPNNESDYDIYVIIPDSTMRPIEAMQKIYSALTKKKIIIAIDILASYASAFLERSNMPTLEGKVAREGVLLYERN